MATTLAFGGTTITLPDDLYWSDEFTWFPVVQNQEYTLEGAQVLDVGVKQSGRPITLEATPDSAWTEYSVLQAVQAFANQNIQMVLTYRGVAHTVVFDHRSGSPLTAQYIQRSWYSDPQAGDFYSVTYRFLKV